MIEPYRFYYQDSIKRSFTNNSNHHNILEDDSLNSPSQSRKKKKSPDKDSGNAHLDTIVASLKTPPPTPSPPPSSITLTHRHNITKSLNKKPSMTKRLEKPTRMPKSKAVKVSRNSNQHQKQHSSQHVYGIHNRRHYKDKRPSSYTSITKSAARSRKIPVNNSLGLSYGNVSLKSLNRTLASSPPFDKDTLDTFCFHWPAMHCYVLVRILPRSIAILPIRTRLAFLYFCHAPRPRQPSLQDPHRQQLHGRRIQSMFKSWKHTLAFNDSSSSSTSSDDDNTNDDEDGGSRRNTKDSQLGLNRPMASKRGQDLQQVNLKNKDSITHINRDHHLPLQQLQQLQQNHQTHHRQQHHPRYHQQSHHHQHHHHSPHHNQHQHFANGAWDQGKHTAYKYTSSEGNLSNHRRQRSALSTSTEEGDIDHYSKEGMAVTLSDVLKDHRTGDVCWIHAPCKILKPPSTGTDDSTNISNFVTLQSKRTTLELKARCYSEKKMFMNLFKLNRLMHTDSIQYHDQPKQTTQQRISDMELIKALETQNDKLHSQISQLYDQMGQWQQDILHYEEKCSVIDEKLDMTMAAVQHHKEQHVDFEELTETMAGTRQELKSHMEDFHKTHRRILHQHAGNTGSFSWVIEQSFKRLHNFQDLHSTQNGGARLYISLVIGTVVLLLAVYIGVYHT